MLAQGHGPPRPKLLPMTTLTNYNVGSVRMFNVGILTLQTLASVTVALDCTPAHAGCGPQLEASSGSASAAYRLCSVPPLGPPPHPTLSHPAVPPVLPLVLQDIIQWLKYLRNSIGFDGWRFDFVRGYPGNYAKIYVDETVPDLAFGEYWDSCDYTDGVLNYNQVRAAVRVCTT